MKSEKNGTILIIEDEEGLVLSLEDRLTSEGYNVDSSVNGINGEEKAAAGCYDLILLDVMLPGRDGFQICQNLREAGITTPILMLTARSTNIDTIMGLRLGADDYLPKPFDMQVLLARIGALLRRSNGCSPGEHKSGTRYVFGPFIFDTEIRGLSKNGKPVPLNAKEYKLLKFFLENSERIIDRDELLDEVWGYDSVTTTRTVDVHIAWLRQKIEDNEVPKYLLTIRGQGYKFLPQG